MSDNLPVIPDHTPRPTILEKLHWRDLRIPGDIFVLLTEHVLNPTEVLLLAIIDGGVRVRGEGCWITNQEFANALRLKRKRNVEKMIAKLKSLGLVKQVGWKIWQGQKCRLLETKWSRVYTPEHSTVFKDGRPPSLKAPYSTNVEIRHNVDDRRSSTENDENPITNGTAIMSSDAPNGQMFPPEQLGAKTNATDKNKGEVLPFDNRCALRLRKTVVAKTKANGRWKHSKWADEFRMLRETVNNDRIRVDNALEWYLDHIGDKYVPVALCARTFRDKFFKIESQMEKDTATTMATVTVSPEAQAIADRLTGQSLWPKVSKQEVAKGTQLTLDRTRALITQLSRVRDANPGSEIAGFINHIRGMQYVTPNNLTHKLMLLVYHSIKNWQAWSGDLFRQLWDGTLTHKYLNGLGQTWAKEYSHNPNLWHKLVEVIK